MRGFLLNNIFVMQYHAGPYFVSNMYFRYPIFALNEKTDTPAAYFLLR